MSLSDFNVSWFTTVPGLLITGGVVLLLFALFLLIATGKKSKKEKKAKVEAEMLNQQPSMAFPGQQIANDMANVAVQPIMTNPEIKPNPGVVPVANTGAAIAPMPVTDPSMVSAMPSTPIADHKQVSAVPVGDNMYSAMPNQPMMNPMPNTATTGIPEMTGVSPMGAQPMANGTNSMPYGGANPAVTGVAPVQQTTTAYGGVDPSAQVTTITPIAPVAPVQNPVQPVGTVPTQQ